MKTKILTILCFLSIIFMINSCQDDDLFRKTNTNQQGFSSINPNLLLTTVQATLSGGRFEQWRENLIYGEGIIQHLGGSWPVTKFGSTFNQNQGYESALWKISYGDGLVRDLVDLEQRTKKNPKYKNLHAISKIMKVMVFQRLTDTYGDVPFSEAGLGFYKGINLPKYDNQKEIYYKFLILLDEAYKELNVNGDKITSDNFYNGDINKWKKLANSLRLRCAMRISMKDEVKAKTELADIIKRSLFNSNSDNCFTHHDKTSFEVEGYEMNGNGLSQALKGTGVVTDYPTKLLISKLKGDPRKEILFSPGESGKFEGVDPNNFAYEHKGGSKNLAKLKPFLSENDAPYLHISYSEVQLLLAEAVQRNLISGNAESHYQKGIEAGITQWKAYGATVDDNSAVVYSKNKKLIAGKELEEIATQQWLTLFLNGMEAYANYRRTDLPVLIPITRSDSGTNGVLPKRMSYPLEESTVNTNNFKKAKAGYPNGWLSKVWWDNN